MIRIVTDMKRSPDGSYRALVLNRITRSTTFWFQYGKNPNLWYTMSGSECGPIILQLLNSAQMAFNANQSFCKSDLD